MKNYVDYCKTHTIVELENLRGMNHSDYGCDLAYTLTQDINCNGTATFSTYEAKQYIREWWDEAGEVYEYQKFHYGEALHNPFENPEAFHVCMIIEGVRTLLSRCPLIDEYWNDELVLTDEAIDRLISEISEQNEIEF